MERGGRSGALGGTRWGTRERAFAAGRFFRDMDASSTRVHTTPTTARRLSARMPRRPCATRRAGSKRKPSTAGTRLARRAEGRKTRDPLRQPADLEGAGCAQTRSGLPRIRPRASLRRRSLGARMRRHVLLENMGAVEMDVNLGRRDVGMPENLLDDAQIRTA